MVTSSLLKHSLPTHLTPFIGRQAEVQQLLGLLQDPSVLLITLLGAGGIGKTRLALETAGRIQDQFQNGVCFIPLAQLSSIDELLPALAGVLGVQLPSGGDLQQAVLDYLTDQQVLLILDNFEHLLTEANLVCEILSRAQQVKVLVTSREKLGLEAEVLFHLEGLLIPANSDPDADEYDAVRLFRQKSRQVRPDFTLNKGNMEPVLRICQLVNGNPLGILLASAWVEHFSPDEILVEINNNLDFLTSTIRDTDPRHTCMRAVFESSYHRLDPHLQSIFRKLACLRGGFELAAARSIAGADLKSLIALVDKSLLSRDQGSGRYDLHELLRQYAHEELAAAGEQESILQAHSHYYMRFTWEREARLISQEQTKALEEIEANFENISQAFGVMVESHDYTTARLVLPSLYTYCDIHSKFYEGESLFRLASKGLAPQAGEEPDPAWALALLSWYDMRIYIERFESLVDIHSVAESCLEQATRMNDLLGIAASCVLLGAIAGEQGDKKTAIQYYQQGLRAYPPLDDAYWIQMRIGLTHYAIGEYAQAIQAFQACYKRGNETGERATIGWALLNTGRVLLEQGHPKEAETYLERAHSYFTQIGNSDGLIWLNYYLSQAALEMKNTAQAWEYAHIAQDIAHQTNSPIWIRKTGELIQKIDPQSTPQPEEVKPVEGESFSPRELEVLHLLKSELSGPEIASHLVVSLNTVRFHSKNIYQKLGVNSRLEAIQRAKELGL